MEGVGLVENQDEQKEKNGFELLRHQILLVGNPS